MKRMNNNNMRLNSKNGKKWISDSIDKLHAYLDRAPILVSDIVGTENCVDGVYIIHEETKTKLFFPFDYDVEPKVWIHSTHTHNFQQKWDHTIDTMLYLWHED